MNFLCGKKTKRALRSSLYGLLLASAAAQAWALDGASVNTSAFLKNFSGGPNTNIPECASILDRGFASESSGVVGCGRTVGGVASQISLFAAATAPVDLTQLGEIKASVRIEANTITPLVPPFYQWAGGSAHAAFVDYVKLASVPTNHLVLNYQWNGGFTLNDPAEQKHLTAAYGTVYMSFRTTSGNLYSDGSFGRCWSCSYGDTGEMTTLNLGNTSSSGIFKDTNATDYDVQVSPGNYKITLGPSFFANPEYHDLAIDFSLGVNATLYADYYYALTPLFVDADFSHTLRMTSINAYDDQGNDITSQAILGFASSNFPTAPVPEPETYGMLLAGLGLIGTIARRRKNQK